MADEQAEEQGKGKNPKIIVLLGLISIIFLRPTYAKNQPIFSSILPQNVIPEKAHRGYGLYDRLKSIGI